MIFFKLCHRNYTESTVVINITISCHHRHEQQQKQHFVVMIFISSSHRNQHQHQLIITVLVLPIVLGITMKVTALAVPNEPKFLILSRIDRNEECQHRHHRPPSSPSPLHVSIIVIIISCHHRQEQQQKQHFVVMLFISSSHRNHHQYHRPRSSRRPRHHHERVSLTSPKCLYYHEQIIGMNRVSTIGTNMKQKSVNNLHCRHKYSYARHYDAVSRRRQHSGSRLPGTLDSVACKISYQLDETVH